MGYDFPSTPTVGQIANGYVWNGQAWTGNGNLAAVAPPSDGPPANPVNGQLWWESDSGDLFIWFNDGNTSQWVQISGSGIGDAPSDGNSYVRRNGVWTSVGPGSVTVATFTAAVPTFVIPAGARRCRLSGYATPPAMSTNIGLRVSKDNGASFAGGASDYTYGTAHQLNSTFTGVTANAHIGYVATMNVAATGLVARMLSVDLFFPPVASETLQWFALSMGYSGGILNGYMSGYCSVFGPYTNFLITGDVPPYTLTGRIIAEFDA